MEKKLFTGTAAELPKDEYLPEGAKLVKFEDISIMWPHLYPNIVYDTKDGMDLHMQIMHPYNYRVPEEGQKYPMIVHIVGSAWREQSKEMFEHIHEASYLTSLGYGVAMVQYRDTTVAGFPAQIEDCKTAIRYLRKHADEYMIDTDRIAFWGDSSGGHTVLMSAFTNEGTFDNGTYAEESCRVKCLIDWYAPTDLTKMGDEWSCVDHLDPEGPEALLLGKNPLDAREEQIAASPMTYINDDTEVPPMLIMHGNQDEQVPFQQSVMLYEKLKEMGKNVEFVVLDGGHHAHGGFRNLGVFDIMKEFLDKNL